MKTQFNFKLLAKSTGGKKEIEGYASTPDLDRDNDIIPTEVLAKAVDGYLKMGTLLYEHGYDPTYARKPVGKLNIAKIDDEGRLYVKGTISDQWIWEKIELGELKAFSIGGMAEWEVSQKDGKAVGIAKSMEIHEVSIVAIPANPNAMFSIAKSLQKSLQDAIEDNNKKVYNENIPTNDKVLMEEMIKGIQDRLDAFLTKDSEKVELKKSLEAKTNEMSELQVQLDEQKSKNEELQKSLDETIASKEALTENIKALDEKLTSVIATKKSAKTDDELDKKAEDKSEADEVAKSAKQIEDKAKELGLIL